MKSLSRISLCLATFAVFGLSDGRSQDKEKVEAVLEPAAAAPVYLKATETEALQAKEGQKVIVYGTTANSSKARSGTNFVNFAGAEFYLITFKTDLIEFLRGEPADYYNDKRIAVTGMVSIHKGKPQFKLTDPSQVQILEADAEFPPKVEKAPDPGKETAVPEKGSSPPNAGAAPEEPTKKPPVDPGKYFK